MKIYTIISTIVTLLVIALTLVLDIKLALNAWQVIPFFMLNILVGMKFETYFSGKFINEYKDLLKVSKNLLLESKANLDKFSIEYQGYKKLAERDIANLEAEVVRLNGIMAAKDTK
jgi:hypothetical protein